MFTGIDDNLDSLLLRRHALGSATTQDPHRVSGFTNVESPVTFRGSTLQQRRWGLAAHGYGIHGSYLIPHHPEAYSLNRAREINSLVTIAGS